MIDKFIAGYPDQLARDFGNLLRLFRDKNITRREVKRVMMKKVATACNTIRPIRARKKPKATKYPFHQDTFWGLKD